MKIFIKNELESFSIGEANTNIKFSENIIEIGYTDISSIEEWYYNSLDYLTSKLECKLIFDAKIGATEQEKFNSCSLEEKEILINQNNITRAVALPYLMSNYSLDQATATMMYGGLQLQSIEDTANACKSRFENKAKGWFPILFSSFSIEQAQTIIDAIRNYMSDYTKYATFGIGYGDSKLGLLNFINNTGGVVSSIEDYTLLSGTDYTGLKNSLTKYFYK